MAGSVYSVVELIGASDVSWEDAAANAIREAARTISDDLRIAEVIEQDILIEDGEVLAFRSKVRLSFKQASNGS